MSLLYRSVALAFQTFYTFGLVSHRVLGAMQCVAIAFLCTMNYVPTDSPLCQRTITGLRKQISSHLMCLLVDHTEYTSDRSYDQLIAFADKASTSNAYPFLTPAWLTSRSGTGST